MALKNDRYTYRVTLIFSKLKAIGYQDNDATIVLTEPELHNWGIRGGFPASEISIGFDLKV